MAFLSGNQNVVLVSQCANLQGLTVTFQVTEDLITVGNAGFGLQLNCFPQAGQTFQNQPLNWFQYFLVIQSEEVGWGVEYWDTGNWDTTTGVIETVALGAIPRIRRVPVPHCR